LRTRGSGSMAFTRRSTMVITAVTRSPVRSPLKEIITCLRSNSSYRSYIRSSMLGGADCVISEDQYKASPGPRPFRVGGGGSFPRSCQPGRPPTGPSLRRFLGTIRGRVRLPSAHLLHGWRDGGAVFGTIVLGFPGTPFRCQQHQHDRRLSLKQDSSGRMALHMDHHLTSYSYAMTGAGGGRLRAAQLFMLSNCRGRS